jgi:hypothetical protein
MLECGRRAQAGTDAEPHAGPRAYAAHGVNECRLEVDDDACRRSHHACQAAAFMRIAAR